MEVRALATDTPGASKQEGDAAAFAQLVESAAELGRSAAKQLGAAAQKGDDWIRFTLAGAASSVIAAHYRATGKPIAPADAAAFALAVSKASTSLAEVMPIPPETAYDETYMRAKMLGAMAPVVAAVARYAFGRSEHVLLMEIATRLQRSAAEVAQELIGNSVSSDQWHLMYATALEVAGHMYAESHYAEADRLVEMIPEERAAYLARNGNQIPMDPVWASFEQYIAMLTALISHLETPGTADLNELRVG